jgi:hypothetical protein
MRWARPPFACPTARGSSSTWRARDARWGPSDVLRLGDSEAPLTHFASVNWAAIDAIPPLAEPARLPPGAGTAVLNLIAALAVDQGRTRLAYRGPYPTEQLFTALLECFRYAAGEGLPLERFLADGALDWHPAPFETQHVRPGVVVQLRHEIEKVVWRARTYTRADWQGVERQAAHRVHDVGGRVHCVLWALGSALQTHLALTVEGDVIAAYAPEAVGSAQPCGAEVAAGLVAVVVASSAPPLAEAIRAVAADLTFTWAPLAGALAEITEAHARLSGAMLVALRARLTAAGSRVEQVRLGFAALAELAAATGDALRGRAQRRLAADSTPAKNRALSAERSAQDAAANAREIGRTVEALLEAAQSS